MLYLLSIGTAISLLMPVLSFAGEQGVNFFEERNTPAQAEECGECSKKPDILSTNLTKKTGEIEKALADNLSSKENKSNNEITLFVNLESGFSDAVVRKLVKFRKESPGWRVKGVIITDMLNLKEKLLHKRDYFKDNIEFSIDIKGNLARQFGIAETPSYVVIYNGRQYKFSGRVDLNEAISKLDK